MNSEELEQSLRTEFEGSLKNILADMTQEVAQFQLKIDTEIEKHKSHLDDVFQEFSTRIQTQKELDPGFKESVVEHLRLARDEGARITATAIAEAEELTKSEQTEQANAKPSVSLGDIRDAINDISSQNSQSSILKSLITHAAKFTPRGAFFVVKNQHFVGWRVFGKEENIEVDSITDIVFPLSSTTILGEAVSSLGAIESNYGTYADDAAYLDQLEFSEPDSIFAIPLIARGRGVAAIYADNGQSDDKVNLEALETLVSVAGLTVELLAAAQNSNFTREPVKSSSFVAAPQTVESSEESEPETTDVTEAHIESIEESAEYKDVETQSTFAEESYKASDANIEDGAESTVDESNLHIEESDVEQVSFSASDESEEDEEIYAASEAAEEKTVYEVVHAIKTSQETEVDSGEFDEENEPESAIDTGFIVSDENASDIDDVEDNYAVYDDDLIEEVQTQAVEEESEVEEIQTISQVSETDSKLSEYDSEINESAVEEKAADDKISDKFAVPAQYAEFETNQDFNSTQVQFEAPVETLESAEIEDTEAEGFEADSNDKIEEISFVKPETVKVKEFSVEGFVEEIIQPEEPVAQPIVKTRFSDRNLDLPIEVNEDERRLHNDARRFARLLVSEIKLYNEQKVKEGREAGDLYDRLREALDRSREMYDKRVQPAVVERFDYFHFEVVNTLADGEEARLGAAYPGAAVAA